MKSRSPQLQKPRTVLAAAVLVLGLATPLALTTAAGATGASRASAAAQTSSFTRVVKAGTSTHYHATRQGGKAVDQGQEVRPTGGGADPDFAGSSAHGSRAIGAPLLPHRFSASAPAAARARSSRVVADGTVSHGRPGLLRSFEGLNHYDTRYANNGNQFSNEPPDQGLCVGKGQIVEVVNDVIQVYNEHGKSISGKAEDLNTFLGYRAAINRTTGKIGPDVFDPSCLYDPGTKQFFVVTDTLLSTPDGALTGRALINISVAADPTGKWKHYSLDVTNDGSDGTPAQGGCPCFGDYPHIGVDANGFYVTTNDFPIFQGGFNGSQIYAFSKRALARHQKKVFVTEYDTNKSLGGKPGFTIWPAQSPVTSQYDRRHGGTAFFLSSTNATTRDGSSNTIAVWALTHTNTLANARPSATLHHHQVRVNRYSFPPQAIQPDDGPLPLLKCLNHQTCATNLNGEPDPYTPEVEQTVDSNDGRMQQVTYSQGMLYGALDSAVRSEGETTAGVAWFVIRPHMPHHKLRASVVKQGKIVVNGENLVYPAMGITRSGRGIIAFTLVGPDYFPSAAWTTFDARRGAGLVQVASAGRAPEDGFSGYRYYSANGPGIKRPRWGDYGATAVDGNKIWAASEYIAHTCGFAKWQQAPLGTCGGKRTALANWSTRISLIRP